MFSLDCRLIWLVSNALNSLGIDYLVAERLGAAAITEACGASGQSDDEIHFSA